MNPNENGVRIAELDEMTYRRLLWTHRPLTDFWRIGHGYSKKLEEKGLFTMGDVARCSVGGKNSFYNEDLLYKMFGVNAELLIDHAWGYEPCTMADIKAYKPENTSKSSGQVLPVPYTYEKARLVVKEMTDSISLELFEMGYVTNQIVITVGYDSESLTQEEIRKKYKEEITVDCYGRKIPKHAHGTQNLDKYTSSTSLMVDAALKLFDRIVNKDLLIRKIEIVACHIISENDVKEYSAVEQLDLLTDYEELQKKRDKEIAMLDKEKKMQQAILDIKKQYGKNAILKGMNLLEGATEKIETIKLGDIRHE